MKKLLSIFVITLVTGSAFSEIGSTVSEMEKNLGKAYNTKDWKSPDVTVSLYRITEGRLVGIREAVVYYQNKVVMEQVYLPDGMFGVSFPDKMVYEMNLPTFSGEDGWVEIGKNIYSTKNLLGVVHPNIRGITIVVNDWRRTMSEEAFAKFATEVAAWAM